MSGGKSTQVWDCETFNKVARAAFPSGTAFYLARITGIPVRTIEKHLRGEAKPSADHCLTYLGAGEFGLALARVFFETVDGDGKKAAPSPKIPMGAHLRIAAG